MANAVIQQAGVHQLELLEDFLFQHEVDRLPGVHAELVKAIEASLDRVRRGERYAGVELASDLIEVDQENVWVTIGVGWDL